MNDVKQDCAARRLDDLAAIAVAGPDAAGFLQAQLSADIAALTPGTATLAGWHDPRGRVLAVPRVVRDETRWWLALPADIAETTHAGLSRYVLRAAVTLAQPGNALGVACLAQPGGADIALPREVVTVPLGEFDERVWSLVYAPEATLRDIVARCNATLSADEAEYAQIAAGLPIVRGDTVGRFTAQMLNLDRVGAVSFTKGCYPGQEVVARTHHLGRAKRRMMRFAFDGADAMAQDQTIEVATPAPGKLAVVRRAGHELLAIGALDIADTLTTADGANLRRLPLPYD